MKLVTIVGARPQFVKAAAVSREISKHKDLQEIIIHTGQHFDTNMSDVFFDEMQIPKPDYFLDINSVGHGAMTGRMLEKIEEILLKEQPDWIMVYGDTNSTIAGALAAKKLHINVAHVEAGLRSFNMRMPEEINRILTDRISDLLFCPTETAVTNLANEGFQTFSANVVKCGDVMQDAAMFYRSISASKSQLISTLGLANQRFAICTIHRAENTDTPERLCSIFRALETIATHIPVVIPLHPRTQKKLHESCIINAQKLSPSIKLIDPVGYFDMIQLLEHTKIVLTDSGGLQKEAFFFSKPCVTLRDETEWVELINCGYNMLAGADCDNIVDKFNLMLNTQLDYDRDLYGKGNAAKKIVDILLKQVTY